jgi:hypothetical protein
MTDLDSKFYRGSSYARVRFTLDADDFEQWLTVVGRYPKWTPKMIRALQDLGHKSGSSPYSWYARAEPLSKPSCTRRASEDRLLDLSP